MKIHSSLAVKDLKLDIHFSIVINIILASITTLGKNVNSQLGTAVIQHFEPLFI